MILDFMRLGMDDEGLGREDGRGGRSDAGDEGR